jgi:DMSO/TMAO reductase YedYZ molybdopterin-dependent catalytic subunit
MLAGCSTVTNGLTQNNAVMRVIGSAEALNHLVIGTRGSAQLFSERDVDRDFRVNGLPTPADSRYQTLVRENFASYALPVTGKVERPQSFTLNELRALTSLNQITRHDCVEGWSVVAKWSGIRVSSILDLVQPRSDARYVVFHCLDKDDQGTPYYESLDMHQARHPQAILAMRMNNAPIALDHGAPLRLKVPTQLGYKSAKWVGRVELVGSYANLYAGGGGYWEDQGYEWFAGI